MDLFTLALAMILHHRRGLFRHNGGRVMSVYRIRTWDADLQDWTPQEGVAEYAHGLGELRSTLRELQACGYSCHRIRGVDSDPSVLVERVAAAPDLLIVRNGGDA